MQYYVHVAVTSVPLPPMPNYSRRTQCLETAASLSARVLQPHTQRVLYTLLMAQPFMYCFMPAKLISFIQLLVDDHYVLDNVIKFDSNSTMIMNLTELLPCLKMMCEWAHCGWGW